MEKYIEMDFIVAQRLLMNKEKLKSKNNNNNKLNNKNNIKTDDNINTNIKLQKKICSHCGQLELWCMCLYY
jgi:hypothetical protein